MTDPLTLFRIFVLTASWHLGVEAPPVRIVPDTWYLARWCHECADGAVLVTPAALAMGRPDPKWLPHLAAHEVCHKALGHTPEWTETHGGPYAPTWAHIEAEICARRLEER